MRVQTWAWLIGLIEASDSRLLEWAHSFSAPPSLQLIGARLEPESFAQERRAIRLVAEKSVITLTLRPEGVCVNPVFEIRNAERRLSHVTLNKSLVPPEHWAWDGQTLWLDVTLHEPAILRLVFNR